jgi:hypothetical protein
MRLEKSDYEPKRRERFCSEALERAIMKSSSGKSNFEIKLWTERL